MEWVGGAVVSNDHWDGRCDRLVRPRLGLGLPVGSAHIVRSALDVVVVSVKGDLAWGGVRHGSWSGPY